VLAFLAARNTPIWAAIHTSPSMVNLMKYQTAISGKITPM